MEEVLVDRGEIATVTINRPDRRNSLTVAVCQRLSDEITAIEAECRVVILTGAGSAFSAGGDFDELKEMSDMGPEHAARKLYEGFQGLIRTIRKVEVPVIAAVNGPAMGAGMDTVLACDMRVASPDAKFGQVWSRLGIIPGTGGAFWTAALAGPARAAQMLLTGEPIDAATALEWGLVNEVAEDPWARAYELAKSIAANPRGGVAANKRALDEVIAPFYERALEYAGKVQPSLFAGDEFRAALRQRSKQPPSAG